MQLITGSSDDEKGQIIGYWMSQMTKRVMHPPYTAMGWLDEKDSLVGAALFNNYNGANVEIHLYGPRAMTRKSVSDVFSYVFGQLKCTRITGIIERQNSRMRKMLGRARRGFIYEATLAQYFGPHRANDGLVYRVGHEAAEKWMKAHG